MLVLATMAAIADAVLRLKAGDDPLFAALFIADSSATQNDAGGVCVLLADANDNSSYIADDDYDTA